MNSKGLKKQRDGPRRFAHKSLRHEKCRTQHGPLVEPLRSAAFFADMNIDDGVLTWPSGYDLDPVTVRHWAGQGDCA